MIILRKFVDSIHFIYYKNTGKGWNGLLMEVNMDSSELKKILAGLCIATLISGSAIMVSGCATKASA